MDQKKAQKIKDKAEALFLKGKFKDAFEHFDEVDEFFKRDSRIQIRMGDACRKINENQNAVKHYKRAVELFTNQGFIIKAIGVCKMIVHLDPKEEAMQEKLAELYSKHGVNVPKSVPSKPSPTANPANAPAQAAPAPSPDSATAPANSQESTVATANDEGTPKKSFPRTPLFSDFTKEELFEVVKRVNFKTADEREVIFEEGAEGDSIYIVVSGVFEVLGKNKDGVEVLISQLKEGDFFGEFGFFSDSKRLTTVQALDESEYLELKKTDMDEIIKTHPRVSQILFNFYKERVVDRLMALSKIFNPMSKEDRHEILSRLTLSKYKKGDLVIKQGAEGDTMHLIKSGSIVVWITDKKGSKKPLVELFPSDFFGEIALVTNEPRKANITATSDELETIVFSRLLLQDILNKYPNIKTILEGVIAERVSTVNKISDKAKETLF